MIVNAMGQPQAKVMLAVPCGDMVAAGFAQDLATLYGHTTHFRPEMDLSLYFLRGTYLPRARATLVHVALEKAASHILWLDADMRFPKDTLLRLLGHERSIVAANYPTRTPPIVPTAVDGDRREVFAHTEHLMDVVYCGMGCMLTATQVFQEVGKPWFAIGYSPASDDYAGEDVYFCQKARAANYQILVDPVLSEQVRHTGAMDFTMDHARLTLAAAVEQGAVHGPDHVD